MSARRGHGRRAGGDTGGTRARGGADTRGMTATSARGGLAGSHPGPSAKAPARMAPPECAGRPGSLRASRDCIGAAGVELPPERATGGASPPGGYTARGAPGSRPIAGRTDRGPDRLHGVPRLRLSPARPPSAVGLRTARAAPADAPRVRRAFGRAGDRRREPAWRVHGPRSTREPADRGSDGSWPRPSARRPAPAPLPSAPAVRCRPAHGARGPGRRAPSSESLWPSGRPAARARLAGMPPAKHPGAGRSRVGRIVAPTVCTASRACASPQRARRPLSACARRARPRPTRPEFGEPLTERATGGASPPGGYAAREAPGSRPIAGRTDRGAQPSARRPAPAPLPSARAVRCRPARGARGPGRRAPNPESLWPSGRPAARGRRALAGGASPPRRGDRRRAAGLLSASGGSAWGRSGGPCAQGRSTEVRAGPPRDISPGAPRSADATRQIPRRAMPGQPVPRRPTIAARSARVHPGHVAGRHRMGPPGLEIDLASMRGDLRVGLQHHTLRRDGQARPERLRAWHIEQRPSTMSRTSSKPAASTKLVSWAGARRRLHWLLGTAPAVESQTIATKITAVAPRSTRAGPCRACIVLKKCRIVTPIRKTRLAMTQLYSVAKASG
jgi:hypothetical protein